jgi:hypothetical protein
MKSILFVVWVTFCAALLGTSHKNNLDIIIIILVLLVLTTIVIIIELVEN